MYSSSFRVYLDSSVAWQTADAVDDWTLVEVDVPTGVHAVKFEYEQRGYYYDPTFCGIWLDDARWTFYNFACRDLVCHMKRQHSYMSVSLNHVDYSRSRLMFCRR